MTVLPWPLTGLACVHDNADLQFLRVNQVPTSFRTVRCVSDRRSCGAQAVIESVFGALESCPAHAWLSSVSQQSLDVLKRAVGVRLRKPEKRLLTDVAVHPPVAENGKQRIDGAFPR